MSESIPVSNLPGIIHLQGNDCQEYPLLWEMDLPSRIDTEKIVFNLSYLNKLHKIGAMVGSVIIGYYGPESNPIGGDQGHYPEDEFDKVKKNERSVGICMDNFNPPINDVAGRTLVCHKINRPKLSSNVIKRTKVLKISEEQAWAQELDLAIRFSMRDAGYKHLVQRSPTTKKILDSTLLFGAVYTDALSISGTISLGFSAAYLLAYSRTFKKADDLRNESGKDAKLRTSLFPGAMQIDRYFALNLISQIPGLVKAKK